jgi:phage shock protein A
MGIILWILVIVAVLFIGYWIFNKLFKVAKNVETDIKSEVNKVENYAYGVKTKVEAVETKVEKDVTAAKNFAYNVENTVKNVETKVEEIITKVETEVKKDVAKAKEMETKIEEIVTKAKKVKNQSNNSKTK